ncbi:hypothetical protein GF337_04330 [candidate division KSB1 bacterium]|nr:hypothetical protein [candidate division KSB1 bacterium]
MRAVRKIAVLILFIFIIKCDNPFATRDPEAPTEERSTWLQPTSPDRVIDNLRYSIIEANSTNYMKCLTDSVSKYKFVPDQTAYQNNTILFETWNLNSELTYITKVFAASADSVRKVDFTRLESLDYQDSVLIKIDYELELRHNLGESFPRNAEGQANFWLNFSNGEWYITTWEDFGVVDKYSWSSVKAQFGK